VPLVEYYASYLLEPAVRLGLPSSDILSARAGPLKNTTVRPRV